MAEPLPVSDVWSVLEPPVAFVVLVAVNSDWTAVSNVNATSLAVCVLSVFAVFAVVAVSVLSVVLAFVVASFVASFVVSAVVLVSLVVSSFCALSNPPLLEAAAKLTKNGTASGASASCASDMAGVETVF